jgi:hypothetical protein
MIEFLAAVEPASLPLLAVLAFAVSMYPMGLMLGSPCSPCCGCSLCTQGSLPDTVTVTLSGYPDSREGPNRLSPIFTACFGNNAAATLTESGGAISTVTITNAGTGYAILGRTAPTLSFSGQGSGATFTPTFNVVPNACGVDFWQLASVTATGGSGYVDGEYLVITAAVDDTVEQAATARLYVGRAEPTLTISGNATATVSLLYNGDATWGVDSVSVTNGGSGYTEGAAITFDDGANGVEVAAAVATARVVHDEPIPVFSINTTGGSGASLEAVWTLLPSNQWPAPNKKLYELASVTVLNGGSGYQQFEGIDLTFASADDGIANVNAFLDIESVDGNGAITAVFVAPDVSPLVAGPAGEYIGSRTDELHSVAINALNRGSYYETSAGALIVAVETPGSYYHVDATEPPYVSTVAITVFESPSEFPVGSQWRPSEGSGATFDVTVDDDATSPTFGQITAISITNGGSGYQQYPEFPVCCGTSYNDRSFVLKRAAVATAEHGFETAPDASRCIYEHRFCGVGNLYGLRGSVRVEYRGPSLPPLVLFQNEVLSTSSDFAMPSQTCATTLTSTTNVTDCDDLSFTATDADGVTAVVTPGGEYDSEDGYAGERSCNQCCRGTDPVPEEITVEWVNTSGGIAPPSGTYVMLLASSPLYSPGGILARIGVLRWSYPFLPSVYIGPCSAHDSLGRVFVPFPPHNSVEPDGCDIDCPPKCMVWLDALETRDCADCVTGPLCSPPASVWGNAFGDSMTIL